MADTPTSYQTPKRPSAWQRIQRSLGLDSDTSPPAPPPPATTSPPPATGAIDQGVAAMKNSQGNLKTRVDDAEKKALGLKRGGKVKCMAKGGSVAVRGGGCAIKGVGKGQIR